MHLQNPLLILLSGNMFLSGNFILILETRLTLKSNNNNNFCNCKCKISKALYDSGLNSQGVIKVCPHPKFNFKVFHSWDMEQTSDKWRQTQFPKAVFWTYGTSKRTHKSKLDAVFYFDTVSMRDKIKTHCLLCLSQNECFLYKLRFEYI